MIFFGFDMKNAYGMGKGMGDHAFYNVYIQKTRII